MSEAPRETFLRRVVRTAIGDDDTIAQQLSCGHCKYVLALEPGKQGAPVLPKRRFCEECAAGAKRQCARKQAEPKLGPKKPKKKRDRRIWVRTQHNGGCRRCDAPIVWFTWTKTRTPTPEQEPRLCAECLARAAA